MGLVVVAARVDWVVAPARVAGSHEQLTVATTDSAPKSVVAGPSQKIFLRSTERLTPITIGFQWINQDHYYNY